MLLLAEFGAAEVLDTLLIRPVALVAGVWLLTDPLWGLLAGKVVADIAFYAIAAGAFTLTARTGLRSRPADPAKDARVRALTVTAVGPAPVERQTVPYRRSPASPRPGTM